jgi:hypothetical protein
MGDPGSNMAMRRILSILFILCALVQANAANYDQAYGINFAFEEWNAPPTNIAVTLTPPEWLTNGTPAYFWEYPTNPIALPTFYCTWYSGSWILDFPCIDSTITWEQVNMVGTNAILHGTNGDAYGLSPNTNAFPIIATVPAAFPTDGGLMLEWIRPDSIIAPAGGYMSGPYTNNDIWAPFNNGDTFNTSRSNIVVQSVSRYNSGNTLQCSGSPNVDYSVIDPVQGEIELLGTSCLNSTNATDYLRVTYYTSQPVNQIAIQRISPAESTNTAWRAVYASTGVPFLWTRVSITNPGTVGTLIASSRQDEYGASGGIPTYLHPFTLYHQSGDTNTGGYYVLTASPQAVLISGGAIPFVEWLGGYYGSESFQTSSTNLTIQIGYPQSVIAVYGSPTNFPPSISGPQSAVTVLIGSSTNISTTVTGTGPITYQWYLGSSSVSGGTNSTLTFPWAQPSQAGSYTLAAANTWGSVASSVCALTVSNPIVLIGSGQYHLKIRH